MEQQFATSFAPKLDPTNQTAQFFEGQVSGTDTSDASGTTFSITLPNDQTTTVYVGKRVIRPGDVVTAVGMRAFG
jgi:hypothetical protein